MNIEKIRNKLDNGFYSNYSTYVHTDVAKLLSIIEQAEKALQSIVDYPNTEMKSPEDLGYTYQTLAEEALQAIRGSE